MTDPRIEQQVLGQGKVKMSLARGPLRKTVYWHRDTEQTQCFYENLTEMGRSNSGLVFQDY